MAKRKIKEIEIPKTFTPKFWESIDGRSLLVREVKQRFQELVDDTGADNTQKRMLCQRAVFIALQLETMECNAAQGEPFDANTYTVMANALKGYLKDLGINSKSGQTFDLKAYTKARA